MSKDIAFPKHPPSTERRHGDPPAFTDADKLRALIPPLVLHAVTLFLHKKLLGEFRMSKDIAFPKHPPSTERRHGDSPAFTDADKLRAIIPPLVLHAVTLFL